MNIKHSSKSSEWYTPKWLMDKVHNVIGRPDFDPASSDEANEVVKAETYYTFDGLERPWYGGSIFINPPGGKVGNRSQAVLFWKELMKYKEYDNPGFKHAIFIAFSIEALQTTQSCDYSSMGQFTFCIPKKRIKFDRPKGVPVTKKDSPSHANAIIYVPGTVDNEAQFTESFRDVGVICNKGEFV